MLSAEKLTTFELCPRRFAWVSQFSTRISLTGALYRAIDAGLRSEKDPERAAESKLLAIAANPGLDILGVDVYSVAVHHAKLAAIISLCLRSGFKAPWKPWPDSDSWQSACYDAGDGKPRRITLVDRWSDDRKEQELTGWRTLGEVCALNRPIFLTSIAIGPAQDKRRHSPWTRCYRHPRNRTWRMRRKSSEEDFSKTWERVWREDSGISAHDWLDRMEHDGCMDLVQTLHVPVPARRDAYLTEMSRIDAEMERAPITPEMRLAGCHGFSPCAFLRVCHGAKVADPADPALYGFLPRTCLNVREASCSK